jgi:hypothetical protein
VTRVCLALLLMLASRVDAQAGPVVTPFEELLEISQAGRAIGRERIALSVGTTDGPGTTVVSDSRYQLGAPVERYQTTVRRGLDGRLQELIMVGRTPAGALRVLAATTSTRLVVRTSVGGVETGRELPLDPHVVLLDDRVLALYLPVAQQATEAGVDFTGLYPRTARRLRFTARRVGGVGGRPGSVQLSGDLNGTIVLSPDGGLQAIDLPADSLSAVRQPR